jgi:hypothetical protein
MGNCWFFAEELDSGTTLERGGIDHRIGSSFSYLGSKPDA